MTNVVRDATGIVPPPNFSLGASLPLISRFEEVLSLAPSTLQAVMLTVNSQQSTVNSQQSTELKWHIDHVSERMGYVDRHSSGF
jgi:hypothetical protein